MIEIETASTTEPRLGNVIVELDAMDAPVVMDLVTFLRHVDTTEDCWVWKGRSDPHGYGRVPWTRGSSELAHRVGWTLMNGPIPDGLSVLHHCDNPPCVRPDHLFLGTQTDNMRDAAAKGRTSKPTVWMTHCRRGHAFTEANTYWYPRGRQCRTCRTENGRMRYANNPEPLRARHREWSRRRTAEKRHASH